MTSHSPRSPLEDLLTSFWSAVDSRAFGMTDKAQTFSAFAHAFVDCFLLFSKRLRNSAPHVVCSLVGANLEAPGTESEQGDILRDFVRKQITRFSEDIFHGRVQLDPPAAAKLLSEAVTKLDDADKGSAVSVALSVVDSHRE